MIMKVIRPLKWSLWLYQLRNYSKTACSPYLLLFHGTNGTIIVMRHRALLVGLLILISLSKLFLRRWITKVALCLRAFVKYYISPLDISNI